MISSTVRIVLFLSLCITIRSIAAYLAYKYPHTPLVKILAVLYTVMGISMLYLFISNKRQNAPEGGGVTWWNNIRPIHALLYIMFALTVFMGKNYSYMFLVADVLLGLIAFTLNRLIQ